MNLQGNEICFEGKNIISSLSLGFEEGLRPESHGSKSFRPDEPGPRTASIMPKATLVTDNLTLKNGILQNFGRLTLQGMAKVRILDNQKTGTVFLKKGSLVTRQLQNQGTMNLDGCVTVLNDGSLQFGEPAFFFDTSWQAPQRIKGPLSQGRHLSVVALDRLKKIPETKLHVYGKSFSNTRDHTFSHPLHLSVETFKNTKTLKAPTLTVDAKTIDNDGSITGNRVKLHASHKGQNSGTMKASQHLDVVLPQIDALGILVSDGDLRFKTTERDITWNEGEWLGVGRNLYLTFVGGHLTLNGNHALPGSAQFNVHNFTFKGDLETAGDLDVQTQGDIHVVEQDHRIKTTQDLLEHLKTLSCNANDRLAPTEYNQAALRDFVKHLGQDLQSHYISLLYDAGHGDLIGVPKTLSTLFDAGWYYPWKGEFVRFFEYYLRTSKLPPLHKITLSRMKSGGDLTLSGQNVNNSGGTIQGETSLTVSARGDITHGETYTENRFKNAYINKDYGAFTYAIPEIHGNDSFFSTPGQLTLEAGANITNNQGLMFGGAGVTSHSGGDTINKAGHILSGGKTHLSGRSFLNTQEDVVRVKTGPDNNSNPHGRWFVNDDTHPKHSGRINHPVQDYPTSGPAVVQSLDDLTFDFSHVINNVAGKILAGGRITPKRALISNLPVNLVAEASLHSGNSWTKEPISVNAGFLQATVSSGMNLSMTGIQGLVDAGILSAPHININGSPFVTFEDPDASNTRALAPQKEIKTNFSLKPMLEDLQSLPFGGESEQRFNPGTQVIIGSIEGTLPPILGNTTQTLFALQQAFAEHYHKGYILPHLKPLEQLIQLQRNARTFALKQRGRGAYPWETLVVSEINASEITLPMIFYRPTLVGDQEYLVPEYWGPKELIHRFLMEPCGAGVADDLIDAEKVDDFILNGNLYAERKINTKSKKFSQKPQIIRKKTLHGHMDITIGGNQETGKRGEISNHAEKHLEADGGSIKAPDGTIRLTSDGTMKLGTATTHRKHDDRETQIEETRHHPLQLDAGDISIKALEDIILRATQAYASRTIRVKGANVFMDSVVDDYHEEKKHTQRDFLGSTTTKETTHLETHQVLNFKAGASIGVHATKGNMAGDAPQMTAPRIRLGFPHGELVLRTVANKFFFNLETLDKNAFLNAFSVEGFSSIQHMGPQMNTDELILSEGPAHVALTQEQIEKQSALAKFLQNRKNTTISIAHNEYQSWHEEQITVGAGLSVLIAVGVSMIMPGIGTGTIGAMTTIGAETLSTQAVIGMINNGGNIFKTLEDMASPDTLRSLAISVATAGLTNEFSIMSGVPIHPKGVEFVDHLQSRMLHMADQIPVESVLSRRSFEEVFQDSLTCAAASLAGTYGAANIGNFFDKHQITEFEQYLAHAAVGAVAAEIKKGDPLAGALGAVVGEAVGKRLRAEMDEAGITDKHPDYEQAVDHAVNIARFTAASVACCLNKDADDAVFAAANAARHNTFHHAPTYNLEDQIQREKEEKAGAGLLLDLWGTPIEPLSEIQKSERERVGSAIEQTRQALENPDLSFIERFGLREMLNHQTTYSSQVRRMPTTVGDVALEAIPVVPGALRAVAPVVRAGKTVLSTGGTVAKELVKVAQKGATAAKQSTNLNFVRSLENVTSASRQLGYAEKASRDL
ncbi:MAG: DUF637 domain-containing protein, partial [Candidatus Nucleicultricaceae bacterium]